MSQPQPAHDPHCIFCKIVHGQIPATRMLETDQAIAFLDIHPVNPGHTLIVPRAHHAHLGDLPEAIAAHAASLLPRLCRAIRAATGADGLNVIVNNGRSAGQTIDHCPLAHHPSLPGRRRQLAVAAGPVRRRRARPDAIPHRTGAEGPGFVSGGRADCIDLYATGSSIGWHAHVLVGMGGRGDPCPRGRGHATGTTYVPGEDHTHALADPVLGGHFTMTSIRASRETLSDSPECRARPASVR